MMSCKERIEKMLQEEFQPTTLLVRDDSALHAGHAGVRESGGGHYHIEITSEKFRGISSLKRHRMIYDCLYPQLNTEIHALSIKADEP